MAYCKERILKNLMMGKQMTVAEMVKLFKQGKGTVKSALTELKRGGYVRVIRYLPHPPLGGNKTGVYAREANTGDLALCTRTDVDHIEDVLEMVLDRMTAVPT